jgi:glycosyltransferase involved in cell wall biosynthesis
MKICVYAISKNEAQFVERFCKSAKDADLIVIADTGSTDGTTDIAYKCGAVVHDIHISPWRFDDARNAALALVPRTIDICVSLDMDEVLEEGWREEVERLWNHNTTRLHHLFDCGGGLVFRAERIHARDGYSWKHICHERAAIDPRCTEVVSSSTKVLMTHYPDNSKSRGQYMTLLEAAVKDDPNCSRNAFYYARELLFHRRWDEAITAFSKYLDNPEAIYFEERAYAMRSLGKSYKEINNLPEAEKWYFQASVASPNMREPWCELAMLMYHQHRWEECFAFSMRALKIVHKHLTYTADPSVWGYWAHDLASVSAWQLGLRDIALTQAQLALDLSPEDVRLQSNLRYILDEMKPCIDGDTP